MLAHLALPLSAAYTEKLKDVMCALLQARAVDLAYLQPSYASGLYSLALMARQGVNGNSSF